MVDEQIHIIKKEKQNSYEYGKTGDRVKLYFETSEDLKQKLKEHFELQEWIKNTTKQQE